MKIKIRKLVVGCLIGAVVLIGKMNSIQAAEIPIAGIEVVLSDYYATYDDTDITLKDILTVMNSPYKDIGIAKVTDYVNIRKSASEESKVLGKLYKDSAATILEEKEDWYKVKSGKVTGYIKSEYLITELDKVEELSKTIGKRIATVTTTTLKVREKPNLDSTVLTLIPQGEELRVKKEIKGWVKIVIDSDTGYVSSDYVTVHTEFKQAESIEEERERLVRASQEQKSRDNQSNQSQSTSSNNYSKRNQIVNYALRFVGNPYVWGGTSLTKGADCSGYTQSVFRDNGISISRTSRTQAAGGKTISLSNIRPGDLVFYTRNGTINHVAIYIGNGKVVGASNEEYGIRVSNYNYRQPYKVVSYIN